MGCVCMKLKLRKLARVGTTDLSPSKNADRIAPKTLSDVYKAVIQNNWRTLQRHVANVGVLTFIGMFEDRPEMIETFSMFKGKNLTELQQTGLLRKHALRVMATIDKCITRLDEPESLTETLYDIGVTHKKYEVPIDYLQIILPNFLNAIRPHMEDVWCQELEDAWAKLFDIIFYHIKKGMLEYKPDRK